MLDTLSVHAPERSAKKTLLTLLVSIGLHVSAAALIVILSLIFYETLPLLQPLSGKELISCVFLTNAPAQPPVGPPPASDQTGVPPPEVIDDAFTAPKIIPPHIPPPESGEELKFSSMIAANVLRLPGGVRTGSEVGGGGVGPFGNDGSISGPVVKLPPRPVHKAPKPEVPAYRQGGKVLQAKLIQRVDPIYPALAIKVRVQGAVVLLVTVDESGRVSEVRVVQSASPLLNEAAVDAVKQWRYEPTRLNDAPVPVTGIVKVEFVLKK